MAGQVQSEVHVVFTMSLCMANFSTRNQALIHRLASYRFPNFIYVILKLEIANLLTFVLIRVYKDSWLTLHKVRLPLIHHL